MKNFLNFLKNNLLFLILSLQPLLDILAYFQRDMSISFAGYFRLGITIAVPLYVLFFARERKRFITAMFIIASFCALHILNGFRVGYIDLFLDVKYILLVAHASILVYSFMFLYEKEEILRQIKTALKVMIPTVIITYFSSYFLKSGIYTYVDSQIGWTGWNNTPSVYSVILSALFPFLTYFAITGTKKWHIVFLIPMSLMCIMNGTKATYLTLIGTLISFTAFLIVEYFVQKKEKFPIFISVVMICVLLASVTYYNYSPRYDIDSLNNASMQKDEILLKEEKENGGDITKTFSKWLDKKMVNRFGEDRVLNAYKGNMTAQGIADNRLKKVIFASLVWEETDSLTKFVGFEQALMYVGNETYDLENDPPAIYFYYGYIGAALYGGLLLYFWLRLIKQLICHFKESFNLFNFVIFINYGLLMVSTVYTGHLLRRPSSSIYLAIILLLIYCRTEPLFKKTSDRKELLCKKEV